MYILNCTPGCTQLHTPSLLELQSHESYHNAPNYTSKYVLKYTPGHAIKDPPNCTRWPTPKSALQTLSSILLTMPSNTLLIALDDRLPVCLTKPSYASSQNATKYTPSMFLSTLMGMLSRTLPTALNRILAACLTVCFHASSHDALKHIAEHAVKYTPNYTR